MTFRKIRNAAIFFLAGVCLIPLAAFLPSAMAWFGYRETDDEDANNDD